MPTQSGIFDANVSLGNITINNTGDYTLGFLASAGALGSRVFLNNTAANTNPFFNVGNNTAIVLNITGTARPAGQAEGTDTITITISNSSGIPNSSSTSTNLITNSGGPYLYNQITEYSASVTQGDTEIALTGKVTNLGNESATGVNLTFVLPTGWSTEDDLTTGMGLLLVGAYDTYTITADVASSAPNGTQTINITSISNENKTGLASVSTTVNEVAVSETTTEETTTTTPGGSSGGGGGGNTLNTVESERFFQSEETFEITRGESQSFIIELSNPYLDGVLENLKIRGQEFNRKIVEAEIINKKGMKIYSEKPLKGKYKLT
ncbi:hypothetical protein HN865_04665 [Candidatus Woesearchaeota archaeon]|jgi:hypothetical protein|nr:hypothetical protein [Candidatus Woesearchaeota archaeon]